MDRWISCGTGSAMMASSRGQTGSPNLLHFLLGMLLLFPERGVSMELLPSISELLLQSNSSVTVVCSGWSQVRWRFPQDRQVDGVLVEDQGSSSILHLSNVTWKNSGRYTCEETSADEKRHVDVFVPGRGPYEWFVPTGPGMVMKETEEDTVPCVVSNPRLVVSLYERPGKTLVSGMTYEPAHGFTGRLNDTSYMCTASNGDNETESQVYYVFSIEVPQVMEVDMSVSSRILKQGEDLTVNCTVTNAENVFFSWSFPRRQEIEPVTDLLSNQICSFVNITAATVEDSGVYVCEVGETKQGQRVEKNITITVLDRGYVYLWPSGETNLSSRLYDTAVLRVEIDAHPTPTVLWTRTNQTVSMETSSISTTHLTGNRYMSTLTLRRLQRNQTGSYAAMASNEDDAGEVVFHLEVKVPPSITSLSEVGSNTIVCVSEGAPPPAVSWYTCESSRRCSNFSGRWVSLSGASEDMTLQERITEVTERGVTQVRSVLTLQALSSVSAVRCEARNSVGGRSRDIRVLSNPLLSQVVVLAAVLVLVIIAIVFLIILIILWRKKPDYQCPWKVFESISSDGQQVVFVDPTDLPYSSTWEIPRDHVVLGQQLGSGGFGRVVEATVSGLDGSNSTTKVAVKMVKNRTDALQSLMSELKVLVHLGPHLNIVNLLGACTRGGPLYLITEFCRHGDLLTYLQRNKHTLFQGDIKSDSDGGYMDMNKEERVQYVVMKKLGQADMEPAVYETAHIPADKQKMPQLLLSDSPLLTLNDLISFSFQISQAMNFLSSKKCIHRDLAARNVLVCDGKLVKVCDFGLARDLQKDPDYITRGNSFLPLRWMSPESIFQNIYSSQSNVWSFGVLMWEIFSLGSRPYSALQTTQDFCSALKTGLRLDRPVHTPHPMYELMKQCWEDEPQSRPSFSSLVVAVGNMMGDDYKQCYTQLTENFLKEENWSKQSYSQADRQEHPPEEKVQLMEVELEEQVPSQSTYIIPATDITIEGGNGTALDAASPVMSHPRIIPPHDEDASLQEGTSLEKTVSPPASFCSSEEEESCL